MSTASSTLELPSPRWWDIAMAAMLLVLAGLATLATTGYGHPLLTGVDEGARIAILLSPAVALAALYLLLGRAALRRGITNAQPLPSGRVYLTLLTIVLCLAIVLEPNYAVAQAIAYPMVWSLADRYLEAVLWSLGVAAALAAALYAGLTLSGSEAALLSALYTGVCSFIFAIAMGTWILRIFQQGERYRALAARLQQSQDEVAALSALTGAAAERERLSRELHDTLTQTLVGLVMLSEQAQRALARADLGRTQDRLSRVEAAARHAVTEARALVAATQPFAEGELRASLERVIARFSADTELRVEHELDPVSLPREVEVTLLRAAQEGLSNARRHARATRVSVRLRSTDQGVGLTVDDDGIGPGASPEHDGERERSGGFGVSGLAARTAAAGGTAQLTRSPLGGARLEVWIPAGGQQTEVSA